MAATFAQIDTSFPNEDGQLNSASNGYGSADSNHSKSPLHGFSFFKGLNPDKKLKADGQPPKRRGPKPDTKPALTRRQELNRQAQRTHRERKEMYIKALEQEVSHLKEEFGNTTRERDAYKEECRKLREILATHGIQAPHPRNLPSPANAQPSSSGSFSGSYAAPSSATSNSPPPGNRVQQHAMPGPAVTTMPPSNTGIDYNQVGIDFVLALEKPCMDHMQMLCVRSQETEGEISGHALMATCPPESHLIERPEVQYPHKMPDISGEDILKLLDLSNRLPLDGEITPVMAWAMVLRSPSISLFGPKDFANMKEELLGKVRCYGFGAVLEEFEVEDAIQSTFARRTDMQDVQMSI